MADRREYIASLRAVADFLEQNPDLPIPLNSYTIDVWVWEKKFIAPAVSAMHGAKKIYRDTTMSLRKNFGPINLDLNMLRELVCQKIVKGTKVIPAQPAMPEQTVEDIEWVCEPILAGAQ